MNYGCGGMGSLEPQKRFYFFAFFTQYFHSLGFIELISFIFKIISLTFHVRFIKGYFHMLAHRQISIILCIFIAHFFIKNWIR